MYDNNDWRLLLEHELQQRQELVKLQYGSKKERSAAAREWWASVSYLLRVYREMLEEGRLPNPSPMEFLCVLQGLAEWLKVGQIPETVSDVASGGRAGPGPTERKDIAVAVAYLAAAKGNLVHNGQKVIVEDRHPTKTVSEAYGVDRRTVQNWQAKLKPGVFSLNTLDAEMLTSTMKKAGRRYSHAGRGHKAIAFRDAKRGESN